MTLKLHKALLLIFFFLACCMEVRAAFVLKKVELPDRFNGAVITHAIYDQAGFIWFLTNGGLHRYDGNQVISFNLRTKPAIHFAAIHTMRADKNNNLWLGGTNGLVRFNLNTWTAAPLKLVDKKGKRNTTFSAIYQTPEGLLLAATIDGRLFKIKKDTLVKIFDIKAHLQQPDRQSEINQILQDKQGSIWVKTSIGDVIHLQLSPDNQVEKHKIYLLQVEAISTMCYDPDSDCILFSRANGLYTLNCRTSKIQLVLSKQPTVRIFSYRLNHTTFLFRSELENNGTMTILLFPELRSVDKITLPSGWIATLAGRKNKLLVSDGVTLYELKSRPAMMHRYLYDKIKNNSIRSMIRVSDQQLLVSCYYKARFLCLNTATGATRKIASLVPYTFLPWNRDTILTGVEGHGLFWYLKKKQKMVPLPLTATTTDQSPEFNPFITCLLRETDTAVWTGTFQGLFLINPYKGVYKNPLRGARASVVQKTRVSAILPLRDKRIIATSKGLFYFDLSDHQVKVFSKALQGKMFYRLLAVNGKIYAGSKGMGLVVMNDSGEVLRTIDRSGGLAGNTVFSMKRWRDYLIAGTGRGLSIIHLPDMEIKNFTINDGLPSNECNYSALLVTPDKTYVGTTKGMAVFNVQQLFESKKKEISPLVISAFMRDKQHGRRKLDYSLAYKQPAQITIPAGTAVFSITISNENYLSHLGQTFYRLSKNSSWHEITNKKTMSFVNMPPGKYRLELAGETADGRRMEGLLNKLLVVEPFYYQTLWFKILMVLLALGVLFLIVRFIVRYRERQKEKERLLRLKIAGDLHDEVGSTLTGMALQADFLLQRDSPKVKEYLQQIAAAGRSAVNTMSDIVWSIDPRNDDRFSLIERMKEYGRAIFEPTGILFSFTVSGEKRYGHIPQETRQNIMLIYKEALANICKHAEATKATVHFVSAGNRVRIEITDNGKGINEQSGDNRGQANGTSGHGLRNMKMRAKAIGAKLEIPETAKGTTLILEF